MEFFGPGVASLSMDYRSGIDVMTTETACLSSVWQHGRHGAGRTSTALGRGEAVQGSGPAPTARCYDGAHRGGPGHGGAHDRPALPPLQRLHHPGVQGATWPTCCTRWTRTRPEQLELKSPPASLTDKIRGRPVLRGPGRHRRLLRRHVPEPASGPRTSCGGRTIGSDAFWLSCYPGSMPVMHGADPQGVISARSWPPARPSAPASAAPASARATCPPTARFSIRHSTRNFPNREGSKPGDGQVSYVALMDARSIAATAPERRRPHRGRRAAGRPRRTAPDEPYHVRRQHPTAPASTTAWASPSRTPELVFGPNIADWPEQMRPAGGPAAHRGRAPSMTR